MAAGSATRSALASLIVVIDVSGASLAVVEVEYAGTLSFDSATMAGSLEPRALQPIAAMRPISPSTQMAPSATLR